MTCPYESFRTSNPFRDRHWQTGRIGHKKVGARFDQNFVDSWDYNVGKVLVINNRVTRYDPISIWEIDMGYRFGRPDINGISIWVSIWDMG